MTKVRNHAVICRIDIFMSTIRGSHIPKTLEYEQTQQDGNEKTRTAQKFLFRQKLLKWTIACKFDVIKLHLAR